MFLCPPITKFEQEVPPKLLNCDKTVKIKYKLCSYIVTVYCNTLLIHSTFCFVRRVPNMFEYKFENMTQFGKTLSAILLHGSLVEVGSLYHHKLSSFLCELPYLQADVALVDRDGGQHPVHSFLLVAKFPIFRGLPEQVFKMVTMAGMSKGVVDLIVDLAYGLDRFCLIHKFCPIYLVG